MAQYKRAPITEAVIEIRFESPLPKETVDKLHDRLRTEYTSSTHLSQIGVHVDVEDRQARVEESDRGYKLASKDHDNILLITPESMLCSRLAPYKGWESFRARAEENWTQWKRVVGYQKIQRLGVRYINRIDVPVDLEKMKIRIEDYLNVYPVYPEPELIPGLSAYTMQIVGPLGVENLNLTMNTNITNSPLLDHVSLVLDLDVSLTGDTPQKDDGIWSMFDVMRVQKNRVFEMSITDNARSLFKK